MATASTILDRDERLASLLEESLRRQKAGETIDWDRLGIDHPDLTEELRQLLAVGDFVAGVAKISAVHTEKTLAFPTPVLESADSAIKTVGEYQIAEEIGRGGMGVVYKAWDTKLKRFVALKMILRGEHATGADLGRFRSEAQAAAGLSHPNIVPVFQVGEHEGKAYFSMKYVPGQTLSSRIKEGPLPQRKAAELLLAITRAVQHAHEKGLLHRDLKPANVLLDENELPLVTDFGLAKRVEGGETLTGTGMIVGTPSYMSPEQSEPNHPNPGPTTDVYSLGAILYECLTGRPPFLAASPVDTLLLVRTEEPVRPRLLNPKIDGDLEFICRKCLEKRPQHRYATAADLAADLERFLHGDPVSARSGSLEYFISRLFRETHHASVLENWGLLFMWHSVKVLLLCAVTSGLHAAGVRDHLSYLLLWSVGLVVWGAIFWNLRQRSGPVSFVEREIAHAWGAGVAASIFIFLIEWILLLDVLSLSPVMAVAAGMVFVMKAGTLSGWFYIAAFLCFMISLPMAWVGPPLSPVLFGIVSAIGFFVPGWKYYHQRRAAERA